jgi:NAD(P) transhydrogenase subunit beta
LVASICFIQALKGLSHPTTSIQRQFVWYDGHGHCGGHHGGFDFETVCGNMNGMAIYVLGALVLGGSVGAYMATKLK